jgi:dTDP-4-dehydrorhamnose 3,5-epimerase
MQVPRTRSIDGVEVYQLQPHVDDRGSFVEVFRASWASVSPVQWNVGRAAAGTLRGVHVHVRHTDYVTMASGRMTLGLQDVRPGSATYGEAATVELDAASPVGVTVPPGVAHGFLSLEPGVFLVGVTHYWSEEDELGCHWADPGLTIPWEPPADVVLSPRDRAAGTAADMEARVARSLGL